MDANERESGSLTRITHHEGHEAHGGFHLRALRALRGGEASGLLASIRAHSWLKDLSRILLNHKDRKERKGKRMNEFEYSKDESCHRQSVSAVARGANIRDALTGFYALFEFFEVSIPGHRCSSVDSICGYQLTTGNQQPTTSNCQLLIGKQAYPELLTTKRTQHTKAFIFVPFVSFAQTRQEQLLKEALYS